MTYCTSCEPHLWTFFLTKLLQNSMDSHCATTVSISLKHTVVGGGRDSEKLHQDCHFEYSLIRISLMHVIQ